MFLMKSGAARKVVFFLVVLVLLSGASLAQNLSETFGRTSESPRQGASGGDLTTGVSAVSGGDLAVFNKSDDEPEEVVAVVIDSPTDVAQDGEATYGPALVASKIHGYFEQVRVKLANLLAPLADF